MHKANQTFPLRLLLLVHPVVPVILVYAAGGLARDVVVAGGVVAVVEVEVEVILSLI